MRHGIGVLPRRLTSISLHDGNIPPRGAVEKRRRGKYNADMLGMGLWGVALAALIGLFLLLGFVVPTAIILIQRLLGREDADARSGLSDRSALFSFIPAWRPVAALLFVAQFTGITAVAAILESAPNWGVGEYIKAALAIGPQAAIWSIVLTYIEVEGARGHMVIAHAFEEEVLKPRRRRREAEERKRQEEERKRIEEAEAKASAKARAETRAETLAEYSALVREWNDRRLQAESRGEPFDEPLPFDDIAAPKSNGAAP